MVPEQFEHDVTLELTRAREAESTGNTGRVRAAARRAIGAALRHWLEKYPHPEYTVDSMQQIRRFASEKNIPEAVRDALLRIQARLNPAFESPSTDPIRDAMTMISFIRSELEQ
jgi:hypothetical protein